VQQSRNYNPTIKYIPII